MGWGLQFE
uniref:Uncharacterized protein n=1 Tax=Anguilla anguilla TaxID=7936 RepID=A0A0E9VIZ6_ANGAN